jgi:XXXCH domain-containing protein
MKDSELKRFNRRELGDYLVALGEQIRQGAFQAEGQTWPVPNEVEAEIHLKEKKGRITAKLKWQWSTLTEYKQTALQEVREWQTSFKAVKGRLTAAFKELQRQASQGQFLSEAVLRDFVEGSQALAKLGEPDWPRAMREYLDHVRNLQLATEKRQLDLIRHELRDLVACMAACHREFK